MKELHHHIFSNTTCISKETMLKFINKQLSKNELYEVEKHMLDCELCSDAYAGLQFAQNSSMLFTLDNAIDKRSGAISTKAPIMRNLMLAASVLIIIFGSYFTVNYFNKVVNNDQELAVNEEKLPKIVEAPKEEPIELFNTKKVEAETNPSMKVSEKIIKTNSALADNKNKVLEKTTAPIDDNYNLEMIADIEMVADEVEEEMVEPIISSTSKAHIVINEKVLMKEEKTAIRSKSVENKKIRTDSEQQAPKMTFVSNGSDKYKDEPKDYMFTVEGFKVYDYKEEYQKAYDKKEAEIFVSESVSPGFENKADKDLANEALKETIIQVTYEDALKNAMRLYKNKKYRAALSEFDNIKVKHPEEVNAQFYSGLCYFYLGQNAAAIKMFDNVLKNKQTEFNEEANWYKSLTLLEMKSITAAKKLLREIIKQNGFYKTKAEEKLAKL